MILWVIYKRNRSAMQRLKLKQSTRTDEYAPTPSSASPSSTTQEEMEADGGGGTKRKRDDEAGPSNNPSYVPFMPSPPPPSVLPPSIPPYTPPAYEPISSVTVIPDSPVAPRVFSYNGYIFT